MKGCQCIPPSPCLPCILGSFKLGYVGGWKDCYAEANASNHQASIDTPLPPKSPVFILSIILFSICLGPVRLSAAQNNSGISFFIFSFFHFPEILEPACVMALPDLRNVNYTKYQFRVITFVPSPVMQSCQGFAGFRQSLGIVLRSRRLPVVCRAAAVP